MEVADGGPRLILCLHSHLLPQRTTSTSLSTTTPPAVSPRPTRDPHPPPRPSTRLITFIEKSFRLLILEELELLLS